MRFCHPGFVLYAMSLVIAKFTLKIHSSNCQKQWRNCRLRSSVAAVRDRGFPGSAGCQPARGGSLPKSTGKLPALAEGRARDRGPIAPAIPPGLDARD